MVVINSMWFLGWPTCGCLDLLLIHSRSLAPLFRNVKHPTTLYSDKKGIQQKPKSAG